MERSAKTIGKNKFRKLPARRQHALLAELARDALACSGQTDFSGRYDELLSWADLDRYTPPAWLSPEEAFREYLDFHTLLSKSPAEREEETTELSAPVSWQPRFSVEVVIDQVRSPFNVGSLLRLIDNFGFMGLVHSSPWLRLDHPQLRKSARGCQQWIPVRYEPNLAGYLAHAAVPVVGVEHFADSTAVESWNAPEKCILVLGNEAYGIAEALKKCCRETVFVPMHGYKKSMNVHHAFAVIAQKIVAITG